MTKIEKLQLLKLEMLRAIELIDGGILDESGYRGVGEKWEWSFANKRGSVIAEFKAKMAEIRRDSIALQKAFE